MDNATEIAPFYDLAIKAVGPIPKDAAPGAYVEAIVELAARLFHSATPREVGDKIELSEFRQAVSRLNSGILELTGVLLAVTTRDKGDKYDLVFADISELGGKWVDLKERVSDGKSRTYYASQNPERTLVPAVDVWHADVWVEGKGAKEWLDEIEPHVGMPVRYECHRDLEISRAGKGYRVFDRILGPALIPNQLSGHVELCLNSVPKLLRAHQIREAVIAP